MEVMSPGNDIHSRMRAVVQGGEPSRSFQAEMDVRNAPRRRHQSLELFGSFAGGKKNGNLREENELWDREGARSEINDGGLLLNLLVPPPRTLEHTAPL